MQTIGLCICTPLVEATITVVSTDRRKAVQSTSPTSGFVIEFSAVVWMIVEKTASEQEALLGHAKLGPWAARNLWEWRNDSTERLLDRSESLSPEAVKNLVLSCPPDALAVAISRLQKCPGILMPSERKLWVRFLPNSGQNANNLMQLL